MEEGRKVIQEGRGQGWVRREKGEAGGERRWVRRGIRVGKLHARNYMQH